jgi:ribosomal protein L1
MPAHGKQYRAAAAKRDADAKIPARAALEYVKSNAFAKFDESVEVAVRLGVDPRHADQIVRGTVVLPAGTVTFDVERAVREVKAGKIEFRVDKSGNVHAAIGKVSFPLEALETNFTAFMDQIVRSKPSAAKGVYVRNVAVSSTMGPGVSVDTTPFR